MENRRSVDQRRQQVAAFFAAYQKELARRGAIVATSRVRNGRRLGPYHLLTVRTDGGRTATVYLGTDDLLVKRTAARLKALQSPRRAARQFKRARRQLGQGLRAARQLLDAELRKVGLYRKGSETRGWRGHPDSLTRRRTQTIESLDPQL